MHGAYRGHKHGVDLLFGALGARADQPEPAHHHAELGPVNLARPVSVKKIECAAQCRARARLEGGACWRELGPISGRIQISSRASTRLGASSGAAFSANSANVT